MRLANICVLWATLASAVCLAQTTEGMITGIVRDPVTQELLANAVVEYEHLDTHLKGKTKSASSGNYYATMLSPGPYRIRVTLDQYQAREVYNVILSVAGYLDIEFELRPLGDVWERRQYGSVVLRDNTVLPLYGPDVDPSYVMIFQPEHVTPGQLEPSLSAVIDPKAIAALPLAGRDVYAALVLQPGVASDSSSSRSLGLSADGQRPLSSNFLLDGIEENDHLLGGPAVQLAPEMVEQYRVSTNNFSAEYGRTSGYIANAVPRSGTPSWPGILYNDLGNTILNANTFQHNVLGLPRTAQHAVETGFSAGGAVPRTRLLTWTAFDYSGNRSFSDSQCYDLPTQSFVNGLKGGTRASQLLTAYPPVQWSSSQAAPSGCVTLQSPITLRRFTGLEKLDYVSTSNTRFSARFAGDSLDRPDFYWTSYGESPLAQTDISFAAAVTHLWSPSVASELRAGIDTNHRNWQLMLAGAPALIGFSSPILPSNDPGWQGWTDRTATSQLAGSITISKSSHLVKFGAGLLDARPRSQFTNLLPSYFGFACFDKCNSPYTFTADNPFLFEASLSRTALQSGNYQTPNTGRAYRYDQPYLFVQEDWRVSPRFTLNAGLRYDRFGAPVNIGGVPDVIVQPGSGSSLDARIDSASLAAHTGALYPVSAGNWAARLGFSLGLFRARGTVLRGGFGTFYDRAPDNLWVTASTNDATRVDFNESTLSSCNLKTFYESGNYANGPPGCSFPQTGGTPSISQDQLLHPTLFAPLRTPTVNSVFLSLLQPVGRNGVFELAGTGSRGRQLFATDTLNRATRPANGLPQITYRTNLGSSNYAALSSAFRYRTGRATMNISWTWSHSIDNQSDPLLGEFFDFGFSNQTDRADRQYYSGFTSEQNPAEDRGNSDFDQRKNLVGWASIALPNPRAGSFSFLLSNWSTAVVFAVRSGLPYTVYAGEGNCVSVCNTRAILTGSAHSQDNTAVPGGIRLLNPLAFATPASGENGNTGRNAFRGPAFSNLDLSLARSFGIARLSEQTRLTVRFDAFNFFNHANLQNPESYVGVESFGKAMYGSPASRTGFPALTPLIPASRQVHMLLRLEF